MTIAAESNEDFSSVFDREDRDRGADTAAPEVKEQPRGVDGKYASQNAEAKPEAPPPPAPETSLDADDAHSNRQVPLSELRSERQKRQTEAQLRIEAERRATEYEGQLKAYERMLQNQAPKQQQLEPTPAPDFYTDPDAAMQHHMSAIERKFENRLLNQSEKAARRTHGDAVVDEALKSALATGANRQFIGAADPYDDMVAWHKQTKALTEIGPDPTAYREKLRADIRAEVLAELKAGGTQPPTRFPGSLADATQAGSQGAHLSEEAIAKDIFDTNRNRRRA